MLANQLVVSFMLSRLKEHKCRIVLSDNDIAATLFLCKRQNKTAPEEEAVCVLFLSEEYLYRTSEEVEVRTELVLQEALVRIADVLRKVPEECERRRAGRELSNILDLDVLALPCWRRIVFDLRKYRFVEL